MLFHQFVFPVLLFSVSLVSAASIAQVVSANEALTTQTNNADTDVNNLDLVSMQVPTDLQGLATSLDTTRKQNAGLKASSDDKTQESVTQSYYFLAEATVKLMSDLVSRKTIFIAALEGNAIYSALQSYLGAWEAYENFLASLLAYSESRESITDDGGNGLAAIQDAVKQFKPIVAKRGIALDV